MAAGLIIVRSRRQRLRALAAQGVRGVERARLVLTKAEIHHLAMQIGAFLSVLLSGACAFAFGHLLSLRLSGFLDPLVTDLFGVEIVVLWLITCVALFVSQVAKALSLSAPERVLCACAGAVLSWSRILSPIARTVNSAVKRVLGLLHIEAPLEREFALSAEDITEMAQMGGQSGEIGEEKVDMIRGVFSVSDLAVREVMTQRRDIISVHEAAGLEELVSIFARERLSRVLVIGDDLDQVRGVVLLKDLILFVGKTVTEFSIARILRSAYFVPETKRADDLLEEFRKAAAHIAVVLDEHGRVSGVVTLEDLIEEIVGDIFDEYDHPAEEIPIRRTRTGDILVSGDVRVGDFVAETGFELPEGEYDTVAGFVMHQLGHIPRVGEVLDRQGMRIMVEGVSQHRVTLLRFVPARKVKVSGRLAGDSDEPKSVEFDSNIKREEDSPHGTE